jgi:hypothetical protein
MFPRVGKHLETLVRNIGKHKMFLNSLGNMRKACFIRRILVASNAIQTIDNEMINLIKLNYLLFELDSTRPKFDV